jgi:DNA repair exonuclease SbcCD ATPase subunit
MTTPTNQPAPDERGGELNLRFNPPRKPRLWPGVIAEKEARIVALETSLNEALAVNRAFWNQTVGVTEALQSILNLAHSAVQESEAARRDAEAQLSAATQRAEMAEEKVRLWGEELDARAEKLAAEQAARVAAEDSLQKARNQAEYHRDGRLIDAANFRADIGRLIEQKEGILSQLSAAEQAKAAAEAEAGRLRATWEWAVNDLLDNHSEWCPVCRSSMTPCELVKHVRTATRNAQEDAQ